MEFDIKELKIRVKKATEKNKHPNLLGYALLTFKNDLDEYFTISGFTVWKSKFGGYNVEVPQKKNFKFCLFEKSLWRKIKNEVIKEYEKESIPVVEEKGNSSYYSKL